MQVVRAYDATPEWLSKAIGYGLPTLELVLAVLLLLGLITRYAAAVSAALLVVFLVGIVQAAARGLEIQCGCFGGGGGPSTSTSYTLDILRDLGLLVLSAFLILWPLTRFSVDRAIIASELVPELTPKQRKSEKNVRRYRAAVAAAETELRYKQRYVAAGTVVVLLLVTFIGVGVQSGRAKIGSDADTTNASAATGVRVGNQQAPVLVDVYEDFQCPICNDLEQSGLGTDLAAKIKATNIKVNYHVMSFLDSLSGGNKYSSRAANAGYCAADESPDAFAKFHDILFGKTGGANNQPAEGSKGKPDSQLIAWGKDAGITSAVVLHLRDLQPAQGPGGRGDRGGVQAGRQRDADGVRGRQAGGLGGRHGDGGPGRRGDLRGAGLGQVHRGAVADPHADADVAGVQRRPRPASRRPPARSRRPARRRPRRPARRRSSWQSLGLVSAPLDSERAGTWRYRPSSACCGAYLLAASFRALPAVNLTVLAAAIWMVSPVAGLRPSRAARLPTERAKKPGTLTLSPLATADFQGGLQAAQHCVDGLLLEIGVLGDRGHQFLAVHECLL